MQNWNQWQLPAAPVTAPMPQPPIGYAAPGADPMATMQAYMQYYNQPAPSGYTAEQWAAAQQQNWSQWQTWQQQYQQWQAQYGEKYQETMKQMSSQSLSGIAQIPQVAVGQPPPLPKEDSNAKPPLPPDSNAYGFVGIPPPHQNNLPLFPSSKQTGNPPLPPGQPPLPNDNSNTSGSDNNPNGKRGSSSNVKAGSAKKLKSDDEELTEAEKTFDAQFKQWEEQFDKWKQQNANHPAKTQYKQDEAKWTSWREKLIERREQMRRKREQRKQAAAKAEAEKNKSLAGDDKILNILSSTENQGLINNLLGIGKTLGLTGKQDIPGPPVGPQPAPPVQVNTGEAATPMGAPTMTANMNQAAWAAQQWAAQYNAGMNMTNYNAGYQQPPPVTSAQQPSMPLMNFNQPPTNFNQPPTNFNQQPPNFNQQPPNFNQQPANFNQQPPNFNQPPTNFNQPPGNFQQPPPLMPPAGPPNFSNVPPNLSSGGPNLSLPPPRFGPSNVQQQSNTGQRPGQGKAQDQNSRSFRNDEDNWQGPPPSRDSGGSGNDRPGFDGNRFSGPPPNDRASMNNSGQFGSNENFGRDGSNKDFGSGNQSFGSGSENIRRDGVGRDFSPAGRSGNDFRSNDRLGNNDSNDRFQGAGFDRDQGGGDRFGRDNVRQEHGGNRFDTDRDNFNPDRFISSNDRFGSGSDRFSSGNDRLNSDDRPGGNRSASSNDRFCSGNDQFGTSLGDRFGTSNDRLGSSGDRMNQSNDKFSRQPPLDRFETRDGNRDSFGSNSRGFGRSNQFDPSDSMSPELKKLMEKRKAAMDVFKPSNFGSFLSTDKNDSTSTSLSESFRKITGDSPFLSRSFGDFGNKDSFGGRGSAPGPSGPRDCRPGDDRRSPDFQSHGAGDFKSGGSGDFRSRGDFAGARCGDLGIRGQDTSAGPRKLLGDFPSRMGNEFGPADNRMKNEFEPSSRNDTSPQQRDNYGSKNREPNSDNFGPDNRTSNSDDCRPNNRCPNTENSERMLKPHSVEERREVEENFESKIPTDSNNSPSRQTVPPVPMPPWMSANFADDDIIEKPVSALAETAPSIDSSKEKAEPPEHEKPQVASGEISKKSDSLPFMGENDPKPEDLNMEPPPDLPNLGPMMKGPDPPFEQRGNMSGPFGSPSGNFNQRPSFDAAFGPRGMPMGPKGMMPFSPRGSNDSRFPFFGPRGMGGPPENMEPPFGAPHGFNIRPFGPRGPQDDRFNARGPLNESFGPGGPPDFGFRGSFDSGPRGPSDFGPRGPSDFGPRVPSDFGPRGPSDFGPRGPSDFGPRGPSEFGLRGPSNFGPRGPSDLGPRGPSDFGLRGPSDFGPRGPSNFGPRGPSDFGPRGPSDFGPRGPSDCGPRGPPDFGPRGPPEFGSRGPGDFRPRDSNEDQFGARGLNDRPFGPRGPLSDRPFEPRNQNDAVFGAKPSFGLNAIAPRGNLDVPRTSIPSLMAFKLDGPPSLADRSDDAPPDENEDFEGNDLPPAFRGGDQDQRAFGGNVLDNREAMESEPCSQGQSRSDWRQPFTRNKFGDSDQRSGPADRPQDLEEIDQDISGTGDPDGSRQSFASEERMANKGGPVERSFDESSSDFGDNNRSVMGCMTRRPDKPRSGDTKREFCIEKQFNYNHGTGVPDEVSTEHTPANVIDYAHAPRVIVHDYVTPAQCFDYGHGKLKPIVPEHEMYPKKDFKNWVENEQNLKDYTDRMKVYECDVRAMHRGPPERETGPQGQRAREPSWVQEERRNFERDRRHALYRNDRNRRDRDTDDYRDRDRGRDSRENRERGRIERDREWDRNSNKHREDRPQQRRSNSKDRTRERPEKIRKELNRENSNDDERSKGNISGQESSAKKPAESTSQENSEQDAKHVEPDVSPKPIETPKTVEVLKNVDPPKTMELPKTPNFTMVDDLLGTPGRQNRPPKIVIILRGPPGSGKSFVAKLIKDKEVEHGGSAPRILSIDDYFLTEKEIETKDDNGKKVTSKEMVYEYEEAMEQSYIASLVKAFKKNITDGFFNFIILDSINEKISDYEEMWSFAKTKGFRVYVCEMEMDTQICLKRNIHKRSEDEINRIVDYFEPTPGYHQKLDVTSLLQEESIEEVHMEDTQDVQASEAPANDDSQDSQEEPHDAGTVSKWERMEAEDKLDRLDGLAKKKNEPTPHTMEDFLQVPDYYNMEDTSGKKRVRWADLEERKEQEKMRAVGFVVGQTNWDRMMDPTKGGSALTRTKYI